MLAIADLPGLGKTGATIEKHTALVDLRGVIDSTGAASADKITGALDRAFKEDNAVGVILRINSPGGSPVQAGIVYDEIKRLRAKYPDKPLYVVVEDLCASGGYYVASAADKIFVDKASLIGSIGVIMDGFGFTGTMEKLGVERRAYHAGENKAFLDPFSPVVEKQKDYANQMLEEIHQQFISVVRKGRGKRLKEDADTFSGLVWTGARASRSDWPTATARSIRWRATSSRPKPWWTTPRRKTSPNAWPSAWARRPPPSLPIAWCRGSERCAKLSAGARQCRANLPGIVSRYSASWPAWCRRSSSPRSGIPRSFSGARCAALRG